MSYAVTVGNTQIHPRTEDDKAVKPKSPADWAKYRIGIMLCEAADLVLKDKKARETEYSLMGDQHVFRIKFDNETDEKAFFDKLSVIGGQTLLKGAKGNLSISRAQEGGVIFWSSDLYDFPRMAINIAHQYRNAMRIKQPIKTIDEFNKELLSEIPVSQPFYSHKRIIKASNDFLDSTAYGIFDGFSVKPLDVIHLLNACMRAIDKSVPMHAAAHFH
ncbi:MAG: hypothetical protein AAF549_00350 [Pseudomonadota bacterium]